MAKRNTRRSKKTVCDYTYYAKKKMMMGCMLFLFGLVVYLGYTWDIALMLVGVLVFLKGLMLKAK